MTIEDSQGCLRNAGSLENKRDGASKNGYGIIAGIFTVVDCYLEAYVTLFVVTVRYPFFGAPFLLFSPSFQRFFSILKSPQ
jgi:hypothetical protein